MTINNEEKKTMNNDYNNLTDAELTNAIYKYKLDKHIEVLRKSINDLKESLDVSLQVIIKNRVDRLGPKNSDEINRKLGEELHNIFEYQKKIFSELHEEALKIK